MGIELFSISAEFQYAEYFGKACGVGYLTLRDHDAIRVLVSSPRCRSSCYWSSQLRFSELNCNSQLHKLSMLQLRSTLGYGRVEELLGQGHARTMLI